MDTWDAYATERVSAIRTCLTDAGIVDLLRGAVTDTWRANRERYEPDELFDDSSTLGYQSSKNLANRVFVYLAHQGRLRAHGVSATRDFNATVIHFGGVDVRLVKIPFASGRHPDLRGDFNWQDSESRHAAAIRNARLYCAPICMADMEPLFNIERVDATKALSLCHDAFVAWGAELTSGMTAAWLGLPTTASDRWLAIVPLWWDDMNSYANTVSDSISDNHNESTFGSGAAPLPLIRLKPRRDEKGSR
jgi:hypothetical protein